MMPTGVDPRDRCSMPSKAKARPSVLLAKGDLLMKYLERARVRV
jgi:hypothetical protein